MLEARTSFYPVSSGELIGGKYHVEAVIGEGGMGVVFAATHVDLHCMVALKVIRPEFQQQPELISRLMLEARAAAQIKSEHVCRVLDVARLASGVPYVVMEYLEGRNLAALLESKGRLSERMAVDYVLQASEALAEAHRIGIVHRDLKPENLFLAEFPDGRRAIKVLDFGISKLVGSSALPSSKALTNPSAAMGSPHYMAPEQMTAASDVDSRADIWALGAILHQLVTGKFAFDGGSLPAVCAAVLQSQPVPVRDFVEGLSPGLEQAILACLVKDRDQRIGSVAELAQRLAPYGSTSATQSATRISRLMKMTSAIDAPESGESSSGTLVSPRQLPTPRTPVLQNGEPTTEQALTSSKRSLPTASGRTKRRPWLIAGASLLLLVTAWGLVSLVRASHQTANVPSAASLDEPIAPEVAAPSVSAALLDRNSPAPVSAASSLETNPTPAPIQPLAQSQEKAIDIPASSATARPPAVQKPGSNANTTTRAPSANPARKAAGSKDPYDLDNFGGRR